MGLPAHASGVDGRGVAPPPTDATVDDPLRAWSGRPLGSGRGAVSVRLGLDVQPLVAWEVRDGGAPERRPVLGAIGGGEIGGIVGLGRRVAIAADLPVLGFVRGQPVGSVAPQGGPALGDLRLSAPITLAGTEGSAGAVGLIPWLGAPTGAAGRLLGHGGFSAGAALTGSGRVGPLSGFATAGFEARETVQWEHLTAGPRVLGAAGVAVAPTQGLSLRAEVTGARELADLRLDTRPSETALAGTPIEGVLGVRARATERVVLTVAGQTALTSGIGAARARAHATVAVALGPASSAAPPKERPPKAPRVERPAPILPIPVAVRVADQQGRVVDAQVVLVGPDDGPSRERPVLLDEQGRASLDLLPGAWRLRVTAPGLAPQERALSLRPGDRADAVEVLLADDAGEGALRIVLRDPQGREVSGAAVTIDGSSVGATGSGGAMLLEGLGDAPRTVEIRADGFLVATREAVAPTPEGAALDLVLAPEPGSVELVVTSPEGPIDDATARWLGPARLSFDVGPGGRRTFVLRPGTWTLLVGSPTWGLQQRLVEVADDVAEAQRVEVVLQPPETGGAALALRVVDVEGRPVDGVEVALDGRPLGRTGSGGAIEIADLVAGPRSIRVSGSQLRPAEHQVLVEAPRSERTLVVRYEPGATRVRARSPRAAVADATARFSGALPVPPLPLGPAGEASTALQPGAWAVLVASPEHGLQQRSFEIDEDSGREHLVDVVFGAPRGTGGALRLSARDPEGAPVVGADVAFGDNPLGRTGPDGVLRAEDLPAGSQTVRVAAAGLLSATLPVRLTGTEVAREVQLKWGPGMVRVRVTDAEGAPVPDAMLRFSGERFVPAIPVDPTGARRVALAPGRWLVVVASPSAGLAQRTFDLPTRAGLTELSVALAPPAADVARLLVRVEDPDGRPVPKAVLTVGDREIALGAVSAAVVEAPVGDTGIRASAPGYRGGELGVVPLRPGDQERVIRLEHEPVALRVRVVGPDGAAVAASVRADGPADVAPADADPATGETTLALRPGTWKITAEAPELGAAAAGIDLAPAQQGATVRLKLRPAEVELVDGTVRLRQVINFEFGSDRIGREAAPLLDELAAALLAHPELRRVRVEGHTDSVGSTPLNQALSQRRAEAVRAALIARGVAPERLIAVGYGPTRPLRTDVSDEARAANRRVALSVVEAGTSR